MRVPIEALDFEVKVLAVIVTMIVIYLAWCSTKVREFPRGNSTQEGHINFGMTAGGAHISFSEYLLNILWQLMKY